MGKLGIVESTLFVPMLGRIYASENFPKILNDRKALELKEKVQNVVKGDNTQNQYTYIASASRSANMDRYIKNFLERKPDGVIIQLGCGLETAFDRNDNGRTKWYDIDLPNVIEYRKTLLPESKRERYIAEDAFSNIWLNKIRKENGNVPILVTASGLFYYFEESKVINLLKGFLSYGDIEVVFDAVSKSGMKMMQKKWMKKVGHEEAKMFFYVDSAKDLALKIDNNVFVIAEEKYYKYINKRGLELTTKINMLISDVLNMVKMVHLKI